MDPSPHSVSSSRSIEPNDSQASTTPLSRAAWLALAAALLGWMFDGLEIGLFPLVARPALRDLLGSAAGEDAIAQWLGILQAVFLVGAATGGVVFGWLGDRLGRVWAMTLSVLTYALFMGLCGLSRDVYWLFGFRFISALGMGGEWSLGVALVMEIWPNKSRAFTAGLIGAAANVGFLAIGIVGLAIGSILTSLPAWFARLGLPDSIVNSLVLDSQGNLTAWRLLMLVGVAPALLTFFIRLMVPESEKWLKAKELGETSHWSTQDMLAVLIGACGPMLIIYVWAERDFSLAPRLAGTVIGLGVALVGYTYPVLRYLQRSQAQVVLNQRTLSTIMGRMLLGACLSGVPLIGTWASLQNAPTWADKLVEDAGKKDQSEKDLSAQRSAARSYTQISSAIGAILGTIAAAFLGDWVGRRMAYTLLCIASLVSSLAFFQLNHAYGSEFLISVFIAGGMTASFYGWLPLYLPELFPTSVRATGQGFSFNFGRILAAIGALQIGTLMKDIFKGDYPSACSIMSMVYLVGAVIIWFAPETRGKPLPD